MNCGRRNLAQVQQTLEILAAISYQQHATPSALMTTDRDMTHHQNPYVHII